MNKVDTTRAGSEHLIGLTAGMTGVRPGDRVTVRYRISDPQAKFSDALGELVRLDPEQLLVRTRRGEVAVPLHTVVTIKQVPPAPPRRGPRR